MRMRLLPHNMQEFMSGYLGDATTAHGPFRGRSVLPVLPRSLVALGLLCVPLALTIGSRERRELPLGAGRLYLYGRHAYT